MNMKRSKVLILILILVFSLNSVTFGNSMFNSNMFNTNQMNNFNMDNFNMSNINANQLFQNSMFNQQQQPQSSVYSIEGYIESEEVEVDEEGSTATNYYIKADSKYYIIEAEDIYVAATIEEMANTELLVQTEGERTDENTYKVSSIWVPEESEEELSEEKREALENITLEYTKVNATEDNMVNFVGKLTKEGDTFYLNMLDDSVKEKINIVNDDVIAAANIVEGEDVLVSFSSYTNDDFELVSKNMQVEDEIPDDLREELLGLANELYPENSAGENDEQSNNEQANDEQSNENTNSDNENNNTEEAEAGNTNNSGFGDFSNLFNNDGNSLFDSMGQESNSNMSNFDFSNMNFENMNFENMDFNMGELGNMFNNSSNDDSNTSSDLFNGMSLGEGMSLDNLDFDMSSLNGLLGENADGEEGSPFDNLGEGLNLESMGLGEGLSLDSMDFDLSSFNLGEGFNMSLGEDTSLGNSEGFSALMEKFKNQQ